MSNITILNEDLPEFLQTAGVSDLTRQLAGRTGVKRIVPKNGKQSVAILANRTSKAQAKATLRLAVTHVALRLCWKKTLVHHWKVQSIK